MEGKALFYFLLTSQIRLSYPNFAFSLCSPYFKYGIQRFRRAYGGEHIQS